ncbi:MAG: VOC family protein [Actinomycetota bacterium]
MTEKSSYEPGTPSWVDLSSPDLAASKEFYGGLFGWDHAEAGDPAQTGGYGFFTKDGKQVAGVMQQESGPPAWTSYISIDDVDGVAARASEAGGQVMMEPMDVLDAGRMAIIIDPSGAVLGVWQPGEHHGAQLVNEPGGLSWNEHTSRDPEKAQDFYGQLFGWAFNKLDDSQVDYWTFHLDGAAGPVGGMIRMTEQWPAEVPAHWAVYFACEDTDATVEKAKQSGGGVTVEALDSPPGRIAGLSDPHGTTFSVIALNPDFTG